MEYSWRRAHLTSAQQILSGCSLFQWSHFWYDLDHSFLSSDYQYQWKLYPCVSARVQFCHVTMYGIHGIIFKCKWFFMIHGRLWHWHCPQSGSMWAMHLCLCSSMSGAVSLQMPVSASWDLLHCRFGSFLLHFLTSVTFQHQVVVLGFQSTSSAS